VSIPTNHSSAPQFLNFVTQLSSRQFRSAIGNPFVEDLEERAQKEGRSLSNICVRLLSDYYSNWLDSGAPLRFERKLALPLFGTESNVPLGGSDEPTADLG
jgi:hypothetical protein